MSFEGAGGVGHVLPAVLAEVERHGGLQRLSVGGGERPEDLALDAVELLDLGRLGLRGSEVLGREPGGLLVDDQGRDRVRVLEGRQLLQGAGRLRSRGQPGGGFVVLHVGQLGAEDRTGYDDRQPGEDDEPLGHGAGQLAGDLSMHGANSITGRGRSPSGFSLIEPRAGRPRGSLRRNSVQTGRGRRTRWLNGPAAPRAARPTRARRATRCADRPGSRSPGPAASARPGCPGAPRRRR